MHDTMHSNAALGLLIVFFIVIVGVRVAVQTKRTGEHGLRAPKLQHSRVKLLADMVWLVVTACFSCAVVLAWRDSLPLVMAPPHLAVGVATAGAGLAFAFASQLAMGDAWRIGLDASEKTQLVTHGPFAIVRNPIYSSVLLFLAGLSLLVPNALMLASVPLAVIGVQMQVRLVEEPHLTALHGDAYLAYKRRVGRLVPLIGRDATLRA